ncbi:hypothetical protein [Paenibacillus sp. URB8-2]|uniref:hypothetical protein n=1 Tax=Paenibacillus sp. URB8-2 TaxID=2741301 RepID=UPI0015BDF713|nr:hypothetical protein [Paenibacillus sp. URB8-2]
MITNMGTYGFRFAEDKEISLCGLFAAGHEQALNEAYYWEGQLRNDGPLLLFQYTVTGEGIFESEGLTHRIGPRKAFLTEIPGSHRYYYPPDAEEPWEFYFSTDTYITAI